MHFAAMFDKDLLTNIWREKSVLTYFHLEVIEETVKKLFKSNFNNSPWLQHMNIYSKSHRAFLKNLTSRTL